MDPLALFVLASFAAFRLTVLVTRDEITKRWRERFFDRFPPTGQRSTARSMWRKVDRSVLLTARLGEDPRPVSLLGQVVDCAWCTGVWVSLAVWGALWSVVALPLPALWPMAMAGAVGTLASVTA